MGIFIVEYRDLGNAAGRAALRDAHIAYRKGIGEGLRLVAGLLDEQGAGTGSMILIEAETAAEAEAIAGGDPYVGADVLAVVSVRSARLIFEKGR